MDVVLTGRKVPPEIGGRADLVTEMCSAKYYMDLGIMVRVGIEKQKNLICGQDLFFLYRNNSNKVKYILFIVFQGRFFYAIVLKSDQLKIRWRG